MEIYQYVKKSIFLLYRNENKNRMPLKLFLLAKANIKILSARGGTGTFLLRR